MASFQEKIQKATNADDESHRIERNVNGLVMGGLRGFHPVRVENSVGPGTPDINYSDGWIESKYVRAWPKRPETIIRIEHYTPQQRAWQMRRSACGGRVHVALGVDRALMMFEAREAAQHLGIDWKKADIVHHAVLFMDPWDGAKFRVWLLNELRGALTF